MIYVKGGKQAKCVWEHNLKANIYIQEGWVGGVEKSLQWGTS